VTELLTQALSFQRLHFIVLLYTLFGVLKTAFQLKLAL